MCFTIYEWSLICRKIPLFYGSMFLKYVVHSALKSPKWKLRKTRLLFNSYEKTLLEKSFYFLYRVTFGFYLLWNTFMTVRLILWKSDNSVLITLGSWMDFGLFVIIKLDLWDFWDKSYFWQYFFSLKSDRNFHSGIICFYIKISYKYKVSTLH